MQRFFLGAVFLTCLAALPAMSGAENPPAGAAQQQNPAGEFIQNLGNRAVGVLANKNLSPDQRDEQYHRILHESFDMPTIGRFALGRYWNEATERQRQDYMRLFEDLTVKIYGNRLNFYSGESFHVKGVRQEQEGSDQDYVVNSELLHPGGKPPTAVDWRVRAAEGRYAVTDVMVENVSQSLTQRQEFAAIIQKNGGMIDALLASMQKSLNEKPHEQPPT